MKEFRPADVIEHDTAVAASLADGDLEALGQLIIRYGRAVSAVVATSSDQTRQDASVDVFAQVWLDRRGVAPGADFAPWIGGLAAGVAGRASADLEAEWAVAMAIDAVAGEARPALRAHHVEGVQLADDADRHELRLRRRLALLGDEATIVTALADPAVWLDPPDDLMERVLVRLGLEAPDGREVAAVRTDSEPDLAGVQPSRVTRSLRPVLFGLAGAATLLFVAIIALSAASGSPDPVAFTADLTPTGAIVDVQGGSLTVTERDFGLQLDLDAPTLPRRGGDQFYEGVLILVDGTELSAGTFSEGDDVTLSAGTALDRVETFRVVARDLGTDLDDVILKLDVPRT